MTNLVPVLPNSTGVELGHRGNGAAVFLPSSTPANRRGEWHPEELPRLPRTPVHASGFNVTMMNAIAVWVLTY